MNKQQKQRPGRPYIIYIDIEPATAARRPEAGQILSRKYKEAQNRIIGRRNLQNILFIKPSFKNSKQ